VLVIDAIAVGFHVAKNRMDFMKKIIYRWWKISLWIIIMLAPSQKVYATVKQFVDEKGVIHIVNIGNKKAASPNDKYNDPIKNKSIEVVNPNEPNTSTIFPEPEEANTLASNPNFQATVPEQ
jgi:hypothetical protein